MHFGLQKRGEKNEVLRQEGPRRQGFGRTYTESLPVVMATKAEGSHSGEPVGHPWLQHKLLFRNTLPTLHVVEAAEGVRGRQ